VFDFTASGLGAAHWHPSNKCWKVAFNIPAEPGDYDLQGRPVFDCWHERLTVYNGNEASRDGSNPPITVRNKPGIERAAVALQYAGRRDRFTANTGFTTRAQSRTSSRG